MNYVFCCVPVAPIRLASNHKSEMISQLLFGECCTVNDTDKTGWIKIVCKDDGYTGWCQVAHLKEIDPIQYNDSDINLAADWVNEIEYDGSKMIIPLGSLISTQIKEIKFLGKICKPANTKLDAVIVKEIALKFLNTAYLWGGRSVFGIDCSGFTQAVYKFLNIKLLRDAQQQATQGELVNFLQEAHCGDLAFFDNEEGEIIHVGILLSASEIIHASGKVCIDKIDNAGIINAATGERTQKLRIIKRYF